MANKIVSKIQLLRDKLRRSLGILLFDFNKTTQLIPEDTQSILFIRHDAKLGDAIVSSGVIRKLKKYRPDITIKVITSPGMSDLFQQDFQVDEVIHMKKRPSYQQIRQICQQLGRVDMVVSLNQDMKMKDIYMLKHLQSQINVGVDKGISLINFNIQDVIAEAHYAEKFDYVAQLIGINEPQEQYIVPLKQASLDKVKCFLQTKSLASFALLNPFGSGNERKLSAEKINAVIDEVERKYNLPVVILSAPDTKELLNSMSVRFSDRVTHFDQSDSIFDAIAAVYLADLVISVDTSIVHIATGLNKPQIAIYKQDQVNFRNWHPNSEFAQVMTAIRDINDFTLSLS